MSWLRSILGIPGNAGVGVRPPRIMLMDAGKVGLRSDPDFNPAGLGPNATADLYLSLARRRARDLSINNPIIFGARGTIVDNVVGTGIWPSADTGDADVDRALNESFARLADGVDPGRETTLVESQRIAMSELFDGGDVLCHRVFAPAWRGWPAGPAIEVIPAERMEVEFAATAGGNRIRQGVEVDAQGRTIAYHVLVEHPSDGGPMPGAWGVLGARVRVDAGRASLMMVRHQAGQLRGMPAACAAMTTVRMEDGITEAVLAQFRSAAAQGVVWEGLTGELFPDDTRVPVDLSGRPVQRTQPGQHIAAPAGVKPHTIGSQLPSPQFGPAAMLQLRRIAACLRISFASLARDYSQATFSATRAESLEDRRGYRPLQHLVYHQHTRGLWDDHALWAVAAGIVRLPGSMRAAFRADPRSICRCRVQYSGWEWVNPDQEARATETQLRHSITSEPRVIRSMGIDPNVIQDERIEFAARFIRRVREAAELQGVEESRLWELLRQSTAAAPAPMPAPEEREETRPAPREEAA